MYTQELPSKDGWYWRRKNKYKANVMYYVWQDNNIMYCRRSSNYLHDKELLSELEKGEWFGPLTPPE